MGKSGINNDRRGELFGAVSKNGKVFVGGSKKAVRNQIPENIARKNVAMFRCWPQGDRTIGKKPIYKLGFRLRPIDHVTLTNACFAFLRKGFDKN